MIAYVVVSMLLVGAAELAYLARWLRLNRVPR